MTNSLIATFARSKPTKTFILTQTPSTMMNCAIPVTSSAQVLKSKAAKKPAQREDEAQEIASFLLALKHRSVTPEPHSHEDFSAQQMHRLESLKQPQVQPQPRIAPTLRAEIPITYPAIGAVYGYPATLDGSFPPALTEEPSEASWKFLLDDSELVVPKDRDLVPDALFVAMSQMKICHLTQADRVGCYKSRELGFVGMCCKHCGGQPGFGRYYPNSVRSLAQTTTSQTILKHIGSKCRFCPPHVRQAVLELQRIQVAKEGMASGRPRYGSRKIFFQRIWARLHGKRPVPEDEEAKNVEDNSHATASDDEEDRHSGADDSDSEDSNHSKQHEQHHLPLHKNLKRRKDAEELENKRARTSV
jgi:hypothetical protein